MLSLLLILKSLNSKLWVIIWSSSSLRLLLKILRLLNAILNMKMVKFTPINNMPNSTRKPRSIIKSKKQRKSKQRKRKRKTRIKIKTRRARKRTRLQRKLRIRLTQRCMLSQFNTMKDSMFSNKLEEDTYGHPKSSNKEFRQLPQLQRRVNSLLHPLKLVVIWQI